MDDEYVQIQGELKIVNVGRSMPGFGIICSHNLYHKFHQNHSPSMILQ